MIEPNYIYRCRCLAVHDGDTATFDIDLGFKFWRLEEKIRLWGINTPELTSDVPTTKSKALKARDYVKACIEGREVNIQFFKNKATSTAKQEKYGRYLAVVYYMKEKEQVNLNEELVALGLAKPFMV